MRDGARHWTKTCEKKRTKRFCYTIIYIYRLYTATEKYCIDAIGLVCRSVDSMLFLFHSHPSLYEYTRHTHMSIYIYTIYTFVSVNDVCRIYTSWLCAGHTHLNCVHIYILIFIYMHAYTNRIFFLCAVSYMRVRALSRAHTHSLTRLRQLCTTTTTFCEISFNTIVLKWNRKYAKTKTYLSYFLSVFSHFLRSYIESILILCKAQAADTVSQSHRNIPAILAFSHTPKKK